MHIFYQLMMLTDAELVEHTTSSCLTIISAFKTSHYGSLAYVFVLPNCWAENTGRGTNGAAATDAHPQTLKPRATSTMTSAMYWAFFSHHKTHSAHCLSKGCIYVYSTFWTLCFHKKISRHSCIDFKILLYLYLVTDFGGNVAKLI